MLVAAVALPLVLVILQVRSRTAGDIKYFRPTAQLRDSLFSLEALKEQFSVERETRANRQLHALKYPSGAEHSLGEWLVSFSEGGLDSLGPSAGCYIEFTKRPTRAFERYLPRGRVDANGKSIQDPALPLPGRGAAAEGRSKEEQEWIEKLNAVAIPRSYSDVSPESSAKYGFLEARYHPVPLDWGDEISAWVYRNGEKTYGNVVVARKHKHVIYLAWRGVRTGMGDGEELLAFVKPYLDGIVALGPGESWVAEWLDEYQNTY